MRKVLCTIFIVIAVLTGSVALVGCNAVEKVSDLVAIKVNNFMAEWENPAYNFTYEGSNELTVNVPYTNVLKVTDLLVSPGSEATIYEDSGYQSAVANNENIAVDGSKKLYIRVKRATNKLKNTEYVVTVNVDAPVIPMEYAKEDIPLNNPDGHLWIPQEAETIVINQIRYNIIRTPTDFNDIKNNMNGKYIIANDINYGEDTVLPTGHTYGDNDMQTVTGFTGRLNGNNFSIIVSKIAAVKNYGAALFVINQGEIINLITRQTESVHVVAATGSIACRTTDSGKINNCTNYINITSLSEIGGICGYYGGREHMDINNNSNNFNSNIGIAIKNCINYGNLNNCMASDGYPSYALGGIVAVIGWENFSSPTIQNCVNIGNLTTHREMLTEAIGSIGVMLPAAKFNVYSFNYNLGMVSTVKGKANGTYGDRFKDNFIMKKYAKHTFIK